MSRTPPPSFKREQWQDSGFSPSPDVVDFPTLLTQNVAVLPKGERAGMSEDLAMEDSVTIFGAREFPPLQTN